MRDAMPSPREAAPPSVEKADPWGWARASAVAGAATGLATLALTWRHLPGLTDPPWEFGRQLGCAALSALRLVAPDLLSGAARSCQLDWARATDASRAAVNARLALASLAACAPGALLFLPMTRARDRLIHLRGARRRSGEDAAARLRRKFEAAAAARPDHEIAPGVPYPGDMWSKHLLVVGGTGAGKSTFAKPLLTKIFEADEPALVFDPKGEFTAMFDRAPILAPWDARSHVWDVARDMRNVADMRRFADSLIEPSTDPMWSNASRQILVGLMAWLQATRGSDWGFADLAEAVAMPQSSVAQIMRDHHPEAARLVEKPTVTSQGILINLASSCAPIFDLAEAWGDLPAERRVSLVDWTLGAGGPKQIVLQGHASYPALTRAYARPILEVVASLVGSAEMRDDPSRKRWVVCDEFPALGKVNIRLLVEQGRSRGFRCVLACQDLAQLEEIHGEKLVKALCAMVGAVLVGRIGPGQTSEHLARALGGREVERPNISLTRSGQGPSSSISFAREQVAMYLPSELASRLGADPARGGATMALLVDGDAYELFWPFHPDVPRRPQLVPAPWTSGRARVQAAPGLRPSGPPEPEPVADEGPELGQRPL
jgi:hypothetical protein